MGRNFTSVCWAYESGLAMPVTLVATSFWLRRHYLKSKVAFEAVFAVFFGVVGFNLLTNEIVE